jgi:hypothetical protein
MNTAALEKAADYAVYFKQKYNAERIADTEFTRAYGNTRISEFHYDDDVTCVQVTLASGPRKFDICNFYAGADLYGRGKGVYPKDRLPDFPFHPNCHCLLDPVYEVEAPPASEKDFDKRAGAKYISSLTEAEKKLLMGVGGTKSFDSKSSSWENIVRGYEHPSKPKVLLPEKTFQ